MPGGSVCQRGQRFTVYTRGTAVSVVVHVDLRALRRGRRPPAHEVGGLAVVADGFVVDAEVVKELHQAVLLAVGLSEPVRFRGSGCGAPTPLSPPRRGAGNDRRPGAIPPTTPLSPPRRGAGNDRRPRAIPPTTSLSPPRRGAGNDHRPRAIPPTTSLSPPRRGAGNDRRPGAIPPTTPLSPPRRGAGNGSVIDY